MTALLPSARETFVNPDGTPSRSFYSYLLQQSRDAGGSGDSLAQVALDVSTLAKRLGAEDGKPSSVSYPVFQFQGFTSLFAAQNGSVVSLSLQNDSAAPGNSYCYGTGTDGTKGWLPISQAIAGSSTITATVGTDGVTTLTLPDVSITSGGTLKKRAFDAQGRLSQEASATTDDLSEGSNLYFTNARVLATTLTGLSTGTSAPVAATDSVLVGIGKLQAQVNTNATAISGKEPTIASGTTAQYWRGDKTWRDFATDVSAVVTDTSFKNRLINGDFGINQRAFSGGALAAGIYGYDRWKAGTGGCNVSLNATTGVLTHTSGPHVQVLEAPNLAGKTVTVSVEDPSGSIAVNIDGVSGTITSGSGRRGVTLVVPSGSTGNVTLTMTAAGVTYRRVQLELGNAATAWDQRPNGLELLLCQRYCFFVSTAAGDAFVSGLGYNTTKAVGFIYIPVPMRIKPAGTTTGIVAMTGATGTGAIGVTAVSTQIMALLVTLTSVTIGSAGYFTAQGGPQTITLDAEL